MIFLGGLFLNGVGAGTRWEGTWYTKSGPAPGSTANGPNPNNCTIWNDYKGFTPDTKTALLNFAKSSMDAFPVGQLSIYALIRHLTWRPYLPYSTGSFGHGRLQIGKLSLSFREETLELVLADSMR